MRLTCANFRLGDPQVKLPRLAYSSTSCSVSQAKTEKTLALSMRLGHTHNRLRLCLLPICFTSRRNLGMQLKFQLSPSKPYRPLLWKDYGFNKLQLKV